MPSLLEISPVVLKKIFLISLIHFRYFVIISPWKRSWPFIWIWTNWNIPQGEIAPSFVEIGPVVDENVKSLQTRGIRKGHLSFQLRWAKKLSLKGNVNKEMLNCWTRFLIFITKHDIQCMLIQSDIKRVEIILLYMFCVHPPSSLITRRKKCSQWFVPISVENYIIFLPQIK